MIAGEHGLAHSHHHIITIYDRRHQHDYMNTHIDATCTCIIGLTGHGLLDLVRLSDARCDSCSAPFTASASSPTPCANPSTTPPPTTSSATQRRHTSYNISNIGYSALHFIHIKHDDYMSLEQTSFTSTTKQPPTPRKSPTPTKAISDATKAISDEIHERGEQRIERGERRIERRGATRTAGANA